MSLTSILASGYHPQNSMSFEDNKLSFARYYMLCYNRGIYGLWQLQGLLREWEFVEDEWKNSKDYNSYVAANEALKLVIGYIQNNRYYI